MPSETPFSIAGYRGILSALIARGYQVRDYEAADPAAAHLILRHDLDMSIDAALPIAEAEADLGVSATYFVLMRTEMYNPWSAGARGKLSEIAGLGHRIGLHFDAALYEPAEDLLEAACAAECAALEQITGQPVETISLHRPAPAMLGLERRFAGRLHAYQPRFFSDMGYCSDSRGEWGHGHPLDHPAVEAGTALQLLTHPIWWQRQPGEGTVDVLKRFAAGRDDLLHRELAANCEPFRPYVAARATRAGSD